MAKKFCVGLGLLGMLMFVGVGCTPKPVGQPSAGTSGTSSVDDHDHAHDHGEEGAHGGHMLHLDPDGVHAEWSHDDDSKTVTVYLDDLAKPASEVKFVVKAGDTEAQEFPLTKTEGSAGGGTWTLKSDALMTHMAMGDAAQVQLVVIDGDKQMSTKIEHTDHGHHH